MDRERHGEERQRRSHPETAHEAGLNCFARNDGFLDASADAERPRRIPSLAAPVARTWMRSRTRNGCSPAGDGVLLVEEHKTNSAAPPSEKVWLQDRILQNELGSASRKSGASGLQFAKRTRQRPRARRCGIKVAFRKTNSAARALEKVWHEGRTSRNQIDAPQRAKVWHASRLAKRDRGRPRL